MRAVVGAGSIRREMFNTASPRSPSLVEQFRAKEARDSGVPGEGMTLPQVREILFGWGCKQVHSFADRERGFELEFWQFTPPPRVPLPTQIPICAVFFGGVMVFAVHPGDD